MKRTSLLSAVILIAAVAVLVGRGQSGAPASGARPTFRIVEATIPEMREAMAAGRLTSRELVTQYLARIGMYENRLHAAILVNPSTAPLLAA